MWGLQGLRREVPAMNRPVPCVVVLALVIASLPALAQPPVLRQVQTPTLTHASTRLALTPVMRSDEFSRLIAEQGLSGAEKQHAIDEFRALPPDLQESILAAYDPALAELVWKPGLHLSLDHGALAGALALPELHLHHIWPDETSIGEWGYAFGSNFNANCKVRLGNLWAESHYISWDDDLVGGSIAFKAYDGLSRGQDSPVYVRNTVTGQESETLQHKIVAPRNYRGVWGWNFPNFSDPLIEWHLFRTYFGADRTEYPDGTHRISAQLWYDTGYSSAGAGGNCFGMSVSSLRLRFKRHDRMHYQWLFDDPNLRLDRVWDYGWTSFTKEVVQQQQGSWYCSEILGAHAIQDWQQDARDAFNRAKGLVHGTNPPVLVMWGSNWGHAVVGYDVEIDGDAHDLVFYDNNNPYRENEPPPAHPNSGRVAWGANSFSAGGANRVVCLTFDECTPATPTFPAVWPGDLPGDAPGANLIAVALGEGTQLRQITDENGRTFLNPDGSVNRDRNTRIPVASPIWPLVQRRQVDDTPLPPGTPPAIPTAQTPPMIVFAQRTGRTLTLDLAGAGEKRCTLFQPGQVFDLRATGQGTLTIEGLVSGSPPQVRFDDVTALRPTSAMVIRSEPSFDRVFDVQNLRGLTTGALRLVPGPASLQILAPGGAQFDLQIQGLVGRAPQQIQFANIAVEAGATATLTPANWGALQHSDLQLQMRSLQTNQLLRERTLQRR